MPFPLRLMIKKDTRNAGIAYILSLVIVAAVASFPVIVF
jgi:hypothetical protein